MINYIALLVTLQVGYTCFKEYQHWKRMKELW